VLVAGTCTVASGPLSAKFSTLTQSSSSATDCSSVKQKMQKGGHFDTFECPHRMVDFS